MTNLTHCVYLLLGLDSYWWNLIVKYESLLYVGGFRNLLGATKFKVASGILHEAFSYYRITLN